jgi:hypothetical protein
MKGAMASEPSIDFDNKPCFLIDARTRQGQSGSPVITFTSGGFVTKTDGVAAVVTGQHYDLLGVYSGRINEQSDLGKVWKVRALREIIDSGVQGNGNLNPDSNPQRY